MPKRFRWLAPLTASALLLVGVVGVVHAGAAPAADVTVTASGDAYTAEATPTTAKGATDSTNCFVNDDTGTRQRCYLAFTVPALAAGDSYTGAKILVRDKGNATGSKLVNVSTTSAFTESTITWNTQPALGSTVGSQSTHVFDVDSEFALASGTITTAGTYYFALWSPANSYSVGMNFQSKENTLSRPFPRLVLNVDHQSPPVAALTASDTTPDTGQAVTFDASGSTDPDNDITSYRFDFGDGSAQVTQASPVVLHTFAAAGSYTVAVSPVDSGGREGLGFIGVTATTPPPPFQTQWGANIDASSGETLAVALARQDAEYSPDNLRLFYSGLPSSNCAAFTNAQMIARPSVVSWKDAPATVAAGTDDAAINAWLNCTPTDKVTYVSYYHEPEDNFTTSTDKASYRAAGAHFAALVHAHANAANLKATIIYSDWTFNAGSGRTWSDWYWGDSSVDVFGTDMYGFGDDNTTTPDDQSISDHVNGRAASSNYPACASQVPVPATCKKAVASSDWLTVAAAHSKPIVVPEFGFNVVAGSARQVALIQDYETWAEAHAVLVADMFDANGTWDTRLTAQSARDAYAAVVAAS